MSLIVLTIVLLLVFAGGQFAPNGHSRDVIFRRKNVTNETRIRG